MVAFASAYAAGQGTATAQTDERVLAWGRSSFGQLGDGGTTDRLEPVAVDAPVCDRIDQVVGGNFHTLAVTRDGRLLSWGRNNYGQLGDGSTTSRGAPGAVELPEEDTITQVAAGSSHSLAVTSDGRVLSWGRNHFGQLGDGTTDSRGTPGEVDLPDGVTVTHVAAGAAHGLALTSDNQLLAWGENSYGQLGDGTTQHRDTPVTVDLPEDTTVAELATGSLHHSLVRTTDGRLLSWGRNNYGQLGDGTKDNRATPDAVELPDDAVITQAAVGGWHSLAVTDDGRALAWGQNVFGQVGDGTNTSRQTPVAVDLPEDTTIAEVATGSQYHSLARTTDNRVLAWGANSSGELGDGTTDQRYAPVDTLLPDDLTVTALAAGYRHSLVLAEARKPEDTEAEGTEAEQSDDTEAESSEAESGEAGSAERNDASAKDSDGGNS